MKIRNKILIYFSSTVVALTGISFSIIFFLFSEYREEEFQQQQKEKIQYTINFLAEYKEMSENLADIMDELTIHDFYDEKMLVFNGDKELIFSSIDDLPITNAQEILAKLSPENEWHETKEGDYDIIGIYLRNHQKSYYAISKAYDAFGYTKLFFLRNVLIGFFFAIAVIVLLVSLFLSNKISKPITDLAEHLNRFDLGSDQSENIRIETSTFELQQLALRFNQLLQRTNEAFAFQKHTIQHISHQLKTPISVLVSELEKIKHQVATEKTKSEMENQIIKAKSLGSIINVLLEISKIESGQQINRQPVRIDEMIFDGIAELNIIYPEFYFEVNYLPDQIDENKLILRINQLLIKQAFQNLMTNCIAHSNTSKAEIKIDCTSAHSLKLLFVNSGFPISKEEEKYLFDHFFRGQNSQDKEGFGLGLVLTKKIIEVNGGQIAYSNPSESLNVFEIRFPLS